MLIEKVGAESALAAEEQNMANKEEENTNIASKEAEKLKGEADIALAEAIPALK